MQVEVVFALPDRQVLENVILPEGATIADAIRRSNLQKLFPGTDLDGLDAGVWGKPAARDRVLREGDRVEIYRPLEMDPREARRLKAGI